MKYFYLFGTVLLLALGQLLFKFSADRSISRLTFLVDPAFILALVVYVFATLLWMSALRSWPLNVAYPAQAVAIVVVVAISYFVFGETLSAAKLVGVGAIIAGLMVLVLG